MASLFESLRLLLTSTEPSDAEHIQITIARDQAIRLLSFIEYTGVEIVDLVGTPVPGAKRAADTSKASKSATA